MPILRHSENNYTKIANSMLQSNAIGIKAKGLLCYMLSCSDNWKFSIAGLSTVCGESKYSIEQALKELEEHGYHKKALIKDKGKFSEWEYWVSDIPDFDLPVSEIQDTVIQPLINNNNNKKETKKKNKYQQCSDIIYSKFTDEDVINALLSYLTFRIKVGLTVEQWTVIIEELFNIASTKEEALDTISYSYANSYRKFYSRNNSKKNTYHDNIVVEKTDEAVLRDKYREEFQMIPVKDRPSYEEWRKTNG